MQGNYKIADLPVTGVRLDPEIRKRLERAARDKRLSMSQYVNFLLADVLPAISGGKRNANSRNV